MTDHIENDSAPPRYERRGYAFGPVIPDDRRRWVVLFGLVSEFLHHVDEGRLCVKPGAGLHDRRLVREFLAAARDLLERAERGAA
ncbi:MAG: hypothetical protein QM661_09680 [Solimonas sp.]